eukprot:TRINITY_DN21958_c0_g1_i2.p1 TRINITY_DN21958_c0_g1~~TRINITY_DN21958_c0_g1_i2.p1  ORF type:complete len:818 (+),score=212.03 TRINITY_DN21958_c0_g1_i2:365-2455(+)
MTVPLKPMKSKMKVFRNVMDSIQSRIKSVPVTYTEFNESNSVKQLSPNDSAVRAYEAKLITNQDADFYIGEDALRLFPTSNYYIFFPIRFGYINRTCNRSLESILSDLTTIWEYSIVNKLKIAREKFKDHQVLLVIPDMFQQADLKIFGEIILNRLEFASIFFQKESVCVGIGIGKQTACVVNVGHTKTTVACVDEGDVIPGTTYHMNYGGDSITSLFLRLLKEGQTVPKRNSPTNNKNGALVQKEDTANDNMTIAPQMDIKSPDNVATPITAGVENTNSTTITESDSKLIADNAEIITDLNVAIPTETPESYNIESSTINIEKSNTIEISSTTNITENNLKSPEKKDSDSVDEIEEKINSDSESEDFELGNHYFPAELDNLDSIRNYEIMQRMKEVCCQINPKFGVLSYSFHLFSELPSEDRPRVLGKLISLNVDGRIAILAPLCLFFPRKTFDLYKFNYPWKPPNKKPLVLESRDLLWHDPFTRTPYLHQPYLPHDDIMTGELLDKISDSNEETAKKKNKKNKKEAQKLKKKPGRKRKIGELDLDKAEPLETDQGIREFLERNSIRFLTPATWVDRRVPMPLHRVVVEAITLVDDPKMRKKLFNNIVFTGGSSRISGLPELLKAKIKSILPREIEKMEIISLNERDKEDPVVTYTWYGAQIIAKHLFPKDFLKDCLPNTLREKLLFSFDNNENE